MSCCGKKNLQQRDEWMPMAPPSPQQCKSDNDCPDNSTYCSNSAKICTTVPNTWTKDFSDSLTNSLLLNYAQNTVSCIVNNLKNRFPNPQLMSRDDFIKELDGCVHTSPLNINLEPPVSKALVAVIAVVILLIVTFVLYMIFRKR